MKYCADTGYILALFAQDIRAINILEEVQHGKSTLLIPTMVYAESVRKLLQQGIRLETIDEFFHKIEQTEKVQLIELAKSAAREGAQIGLRFGMPITDAIIAATGKLSSCNALLARDSDFKTMTKNQYLKVQSW